MEFDISLYACMNDAPLSFMVSSNLGIQPFSRIVTGFLETMNLYSFSRTTIDVSEASEV